MAKKNKKKSQVPQKTVPAIDQHQLELSAQQLLQIQKHSGPLPPPEILQHYDVALPGAAERILVMAEDQSKHRQELENKAINSDVLNSRIGLLCGFIIGMTTIICGTVLGIKGHAGYGTFLGGMGLTGLVGVFVYGSQTRRQERKDRLSMMVEK